MPDLVLVRPFPRMTIVGAIKEAMKAKEQPPTIREAYDAIIAGGLYTFNAENPVGVYRYQGSNDVNAKSMFPTV